jgi:hypothetical protein
MSAFVIEYETGGIEFEFTPGKGTAGELTATLNDETVVAKVDIASARGRSTFVREALELYPDAFTLSELEFRRALADLAVYVTEEFKIRAAKAEEGEEDAVDDAVEVDDEAAEALIAAPGVLERYVETMAQIHKVYGDRAQMKVVALGALSS